MVLPLNGIRYLVNMRINQPLTLTNVQLCCELDIVINSRRRRNQFVGLSNFAGQVSLLDSNAKICAPLSGASVKNVKGDLESSSRNQIRLTLSRERDRWKSLSRNR